MPRSAVTVAPCNGFPPWCGIISLSIAAAAKARQHSTLKQNADDRSAEFGGTEGDTRDEVARLAEAWRARRSGVARLHRRSRHQLMPCSCHRVLTFRSFAACG